MPSEGSLAPDFELPADGGDSIRLSSLRGKHVVLYFYPKDDTPGCTVEAKQFTELHTPLTKAGAVVLGVSRDTVTSHCRFRDKYKLAFALLADTDRKVHELYGAWGEKVMYGKKVEGAKRCTFLIAPDGKITKVWASVKADGHAASVLAALTGKAAPEPAAKPASPAKSSAKKAGSAKPSGKAATKKR
ncbi:MAG: peroxiredoxin [Deltaproteobacteria bacterium]|nr:peroxiredoxin [Deltaproteobacteria bacterium]